MSEVASNVLHNVGNVLNSVNVSANVLSDYVEGFAVWRLERVVELLKEHESALASFLTQDSRGARVVPLLGGLVEHFRGQESTIQKELQSLRNNVAHINDIVAMQQSYAKLAGVQEIVEVTALVEDSLRMNAGALARHGVDVHRDYGARPRVNLDKHKVLQILVNLVRNAKYACDESALPDRRITLQVTERDGRVQIQVIDNGVGIPQENLTRIFQHGFTTRSGGHGFGLHGAAIAARELKGSLTVHSDGPGSGAMFTLDLPVYSEEPASAKVVHA
jgi:signal transduction histidine kinase